jgi:hypothetical protein
LERIEVGGGHVPHVPKTAVGSPGWATKNRKTHFSEPAPFSHEAGVDDRRRRDFLRVPSAPPVAAAGWPAKTKKTKTVSAETKNVSELDCKRPIEAQGAEGDKKTSTAARLRRARSA